MALPLCVVAQSVPDLGELAESSRDARQKAYDYSFESGGIGVIISFGQNNNVTVDHIGYAFTQEIIRRGFAARYFYYQTDWEGAAVSFRIRASILGPWNTQEAASNMSDIIARAEAAKRVHGR